MQMKACINKTFPDVIHVNGDSCLPKVVYIWFGVYMKKFQLYQTH